MRLTLILFLFISQLLVAQNISGVILESKSKQPLENVTIFIKKNNSGTVSDSSGKFNLSLNGYYLTVARIIAENNIDMEIEGFIQSNSKKKLVIVGNFSKKDH